MRDPPDDELLQLIIQSDLALFNDGVEVNQRGFHVPQAVMKSLGYVSYVLAGPYTPPIFIRIRAIFDRLYRKHDLAVGGHLGVYMFRDIFARVSVPHVVGMVSITPLEWVELTDLQKRLLASEPDNFNCYHDQLADLFDLEYGIAELNDPFSKNELVDKFLNLSRLHLLATAAIVTGGYDYRGAVQSSLLAIELALKSLAAASGLEEDEIKKRFAHKLEELISFLRQGWPSFDAERVSRVVASQPSYVPNRYAKEQPKRVTVGHIVMGAQYITAEVTRQLSARDFRRDGGHPWARSYPA